MAKTTGGSKVVIIGAGQVGSATAFCMAIQQVCSELVLIDIDIEKAEGEAMDIAHGLPFLGEMDIRSGGYEEVAFADLIVVTDGAARKPGETRLDLAARNCRIAKSMTESIMEYYNGGVILVVANPVDVLTYKVQQWSGLPASKVIGSGTALDTIRFRYLLGHKLGVDVTNVHAFILGEHGDSQFPVWSQIFISCIELEQFLKSTKMEVSEEERAALLEQTKTAGAEIIKRKGATFNGVAVSVSTIAQSILRDTSTIRPVGCVLQGEYGIEGCCLSVPAIIGKNGIEKIIKSILPEHEYQQLLNSAAKVKEVLEFVKDI